MRLFLFVPTNMSNKYLEKVASTLTKKKEHGKIKTKSTSGFLGVHKYHQHNDSAILAKLTHTQPHKAKK